MSQRFGGFFSELPQRDYVRLGVIFNSFWEGTTPSGGSLADDIPKMSIDELIENIDDIYEAYAGDDIWDYKGKENREYFLAHQESYLELRRQMTDLQRIRSKLVDKKKSQEAFIDRESQRKD